MAATSTQKAALCLLALLALAAAPVSAIGGNSQPQASALADSQTSDERLKTLTLQQLGNIEVTSVTKEPEVLWKTPAAIYVITQQDIQRYGATTIPEALRLAPGVEVARINADQWAIGIRGFGSRLSRSVLVLIDGRIVYSPLTAGVYWEVQDYPIEDIERIEVIRGPGGTIWGANAVNGVINIITKSSKDTQGGLVAGGAGNVEEGFGEARYGGSASVAQNFTYRVYGKGYSRTPEYHAPGVPRYDSWQGGQAGFRSDWTGGSRDSYSLSGDFYYQSFGEAVGDSSYNPPANYTFFGQAPLSGGNVLFRWRRKLGDKHDLQLNTYYDQTSRHELNFGDVRNTFDVDAQYRFPLPRQEVTVGLGLYASHGHEEQVLTGLEFRPDVRTDQVYSAFLQDEIALVPERLSLFAGSKFLKTNYTGVLLEPSVRLLYTPSSTQTLWAAFTQAVRTPADVERDFYLASLVRFVDGLPFFARFNANRNFQSERLNGYEAGYRRLLAAKVYLDIAAFYNQYRNLLSEDVTGSIFLETDPAPPHLLLPAEFGNGLKATSSGGEIAGEYRPKEFWRLRASYSFLEFHVESAPGSQDIGSAPGVQGSSPRNEALLQTGFDLPKSVSLDIYARYFGRLPAFSIPGYWTGDATLGYNLTRQLRLTLVGQNLFQPRHYEFSYDPSGTVGIERSLFGKVTWRWE